MVTALKEQRTLLPTRTVRCTAYATCDMTKCEHREQHKHNFGKPEAFCSSYPCFLSGGHCEEVEPCYFCEQMFPVSELESFDDIQACSHCIAAVPVHRVEVTV